MGFFDRFKKSATPARHPAAATPSPPPAPEPPFTPKVAAVPAGNLLPQLAAAREQLETRDLPAALAIYEEVLVAAGDRPDVLVTISGDLGSCGYVEPIAELIAPRYDAERHGPATGLNLLQAYIATRNPGAAQHLLDILFELKRPELDERLWGFSNAIGELIEAQKRGSVNGHDGGPATAPQPVELVSISKPIWAYGVDTVPGVLPAKDGPLRRVGFAQLATPGLPNLDAVMKRPEDALGRFARGLPLWLAETMYFSRQYAPIAALGLLGREHYALFSSEWTTDNIRQLVESAPGGLDYVLTGAIQEQSGDFALLLRLFEVKKFRERKTFTARWTPATADRELATLHEQVRLFFEWTAYPAGDGVAYAPPLRATAWIDTLAASVSTFLADKNVLPAAQLAPLPTPLIPAASSEAASLAHLTLRDRCHRLNVTPPPDEPLAASSLIEQANQAL